MSVGPPCGSSAVPPVDRGSPAANGRVQPLAGHLNRPVEHLLDRPRGPLDPRLRRAGPEVLRGLHDRDRGIVQVRQRLGQEVRARREVRVHDDQVFGAGLGEGVAQVAGLLAGGPVGPVNIGVAERPSHQAGLLRRPVVKDVSSRLTLVILDEARDGSPGIAEQFNRLAADGQVDVHVRIGRRVPRRDARLVGGEVETGTREIHRQADGLVHDIDSGEDQKGQEHQVLGLEPDLADDEAARADEDHGRQVGQVPLDVGVFLVVIRGMRGH